MVQPEQVLLDRGFGDHEVSGDVPGGRRRDESVLAERRLAERGYDVDLAPGQFRRAGPARVGLRQHVLGGQPADPAALRAEGQHVTVLKQPLGHDLAVDPGAVPG